ncbi:MAG: hypothetical protein IPG94_20920 [Kineosporiaceae bacterium]|nr:hypothetical protein [Kineosporiaceae bacterium]
MRARGSRRLPRLHAVQLHVVGNLLLDQGFAATCLELRGPRVDGSLSLTRACLNTRRTSRSTAGPCGSVRD